MGRNTCYGYWFNTGNAGNIRWGKDDDGNGNRFPLYLAPYQLFNKYHYVNDVLNKTAVLDFYLYHLLKHELKSYPEVEVLKPQSYEGAKYLFRLAERVVTGFEGKLLHNEEVVDFISFTGSVIDSLYLEIVFSSENYKIVWALSMHPLDMPWAFQIKVITEQGMEFELNKWKAAQIGNNETPYEVSPNLLDDPEGLGDELARDMATDLAVFLREIKSR